MKTLKDVMKSDVVWVSPSARVKQAIVLLKGYGIDALPVVYTHDSVVGMIYATGLLGHAEDEAVMDAMDTNYTALPPDTPVFQAAEMMKSGGMSHLLVVEKAKLIGIVSRGDVVGELGKSYDTLTKLPWQDAFREWSISALDRGLEISIMLIDLNSFGKFNKRYGHVMGDNVLKSVADVLTAGVDPEKDFLCRYAGDEFAIASYRKATEAQEFGETLMRGISEIQIEGLPEGVGATFGIAGGRRAGQRVTIHSAATLDDLITNASLNCTACKPTKQEEPGAEVAERAVSPEEPKATAPHPRIKIQAIKISTTATEATAQVVLSYGEHEFSHTATGYSVGGRNVLRLVAEATASAASRSLAPGHGITIDDVISFRAGDEREFVSVIATFITPRTTNTTAGGAMVRHFDPYRAAAAALLSAINRQVDIVPRMQPSPEEL